MVAEVNRRRMFFEDESNVMMLGYDIDRVLYEGETVNEQKILIFESKAFGRTLAIDGMVQNSVDTEFIYNEMMAHMPMDCQKVPKSVLIIGGGSGLTVNQVLKYKSVEKITLCDISDEIINLCKKYFPDYYTSKLLNDDKVNLVIGDGYEFVKTQRNIDAIIVDCCDPIGCATKLYSKRFYVNCINALSDKGVLCVQCGSPLFGAGKREHYILHYYLNKRQKFQKDIKFIDVMFCCPMIVGGFYMLTLVTKDMGLLWTNSEHIHGEDCKFYNPSLREQYFMIPNFMIDKLEVK